MNAPVIPDAHIKRFSTLDVVRMVEAGVLTPDEKVELIDGRLLAMSPKNRRHEHWKDRLTRAFNRVLPDEVMLSVETSLYLESRERGRTFLEPDITLWPAAIDAEARRGPDVILAVEIADTTLAYDLKTKPAVYARFGVARLWVVDVNETIVHEHLDPEAAGYRTIISHSFDDELETGVAGVGVTLSAVG